MMKTTVISFLLDETGSMQSIKDDTIGGFNSYLDGLETDNGKYEFTLVKFDSNRHTNVCSGVALKDVPRLTQDNYSPGAMTPLIDASMKLILATEKVVGKRKINVLVVIQTDGHENASTEYSRDDLAAKVKEKTAEGWAFTYLGAGIDAFADAQSFGIAMASTVSYDRAETQSTMDALALNTRIFAATGATASMNYSAEQRSTVGDVHHGKYSGATEKQQARRKERQRRKSPVDDMDLTK